MEFTVEVTKEKKIRVYAGQLDFRSDYWKVVASLFKNKEAILVYNQTTSGAYCSTPDPNLAKEYNSDYNNRHEILESFHNNGHGEGATNLVALARLMQVTSPDKIALEINYI